MISKKDFTEIIESMREQYHYDKSYCFGISELFKTEDVVMYDNSLLIKSLIKMLRIYFPTDQDGFCEIEHYCYQLEFGKLGETIETAEEFYDRLTKN